jgi:pyruvate/2-oxoglutarate dehydrogenase complex dihydrolipoamide dehydrogenase (E3) component
VTTTGAGTEQFDAIVIGAGQAGPGVAGRLAGEGQRVAVVEMAQVGGTCLNHGCRPTKALRASGVAAHAARRAGDYGVRTGEVTVDFPAVMARMHDMIDGMRAPLLAWLTGDEHIELIEGRAELVTGSDGTHTVTVGTATEARTLTTRAVYLDLGARAVIPPIEGLTGVDYLDEFGLLALTALPERLVVVGGSYIGLEFAQMFGRFGSDVTVVAGGGVAPREDADVSALVEELLTDEGVRVVKAHTTAVSQDGLELVVTLDTGETIRGSHLLVATGRTPNTDLLGPDHGLALTDRGFVEIDARFATSVPGVWALGDVNGHGAFTHTAYQDAQILADPDRSLDGRITAYAMFTDPPLGRVGMTEKEARGSGRQVLKADLPMSSVSRAVLDGETVGMMRILVDADSEEILGACFFGMHGDDLAQQVGLAMQAGLPYPVVRDALPIHPSVAEFIPSLLSSLQPLDA